MVPSIPYCGISPAPGEVAWNLDPAVLATLAALAVCHVSALKREGRVPVVLVLSGWLLVAAVLVSPLCNLSVALFSARTVQHILLTVVAAPLLAASSPRLLAGPGLWTSCVTFALVLWGWHTPVLYSATFDSTAVYWSMHLSLGVTSLWLWARLFKLRSNPFIALAVSLVTGLQMSLLGALLTLGTKPWFAVHLETTWPWGMSPLQDQQLGGLIMWVPAGLITAALAVVVFGFEVIRPKAAPPLPPQVLR